MRLNRRIFLGGSLAIASLPRLSLAQSAAGALVLTAEKSEATLLTGTGGKSPVWRFLKDRPMAVVEVKQGEEVKGQLVNLLDEEIWLQFNGVRGAAEAMTLNCLPGAGNAVDFSFTPPDAGTFWFGPMTRVSAQRGMGLYGMLVVKEAANPPDFNEVPLIISDWALDDNGKPKGKFDDLDDAIADGRLGNWYTVNGAFRPHIRVDRQKPQRLRLLNACNARNLELSFRGAEIFVIAEDGQPVPIHVLADERAKLAPGQRIDLMVDKLPDLLTIGLALAEDSVILAVIEPTGTDTAPSLPDNFALPKNPLSEPTERSSAREITITIAGGTRGGLKSAKVGDEELDLRKLLEKGLAWAFNGYAGAGGPPLFEAKKGETLVLALDNITAFPQPLHIHGHVWKLVEADGSLRDAEPWRDTIVVPPLAKAKMLLVADNPGAWVLQSLIAERVDAGLLAAFTVAGA
jgi:FtsP/CotA-like multicopper oxidase with cupredoxin domain